ncbi:Adhesion G-protein coupled receptor V1 [Geodia barretti]|uniref:Adhesion G-protein coupled receptor V1 n=1 Tax=Geodia barretti TaxID=519541 RepID=A0AA35S650_GEOBA|nr:Adhesion G-protein coupled receptor V1 [Geodia barretti]
MVWNFRCVWSAGDCCYTPEFSVSLVSTLLPVVLAMLATIAFLSHSCVYWSRWEDFHNMYLDSFNKTEIPLLLMFFAMVFLSGVGAYVHLYVREVYTFGIFVTLEFFQGLYTLVVYVFLSWHTLTRKHKKYGIDDEVEPILPSRTRAP